MGHSVVAKKGEMKKEEDDEVKRLLDKSKE